MPTPGGSPQLYCSDSPQAAKGDLLLHSIHQQPPWKDVRSWEEVRSWLPFSLIKAERNLKLPDALHGGLQSGELGSEPLRCGRLVVCVCMCARLALFKAPTKAEPGRLVLNAV